MNNTTLKSYPYLIKYLETIPAESIADHLANGLRYHDWANIEDGSEDHVFVTTEINFEKELALSTTAYGGKELSSILFTEGRILELAKQFVPLLDLPTSIPHRGLYIHVIPANNIHDGKIASFRFLKKSQHPTPISQTLPIPTL